MYLGEDKGFYSVPYVYIGQRVNMVYNVSTVEIYCQVKRIALHKRSTDVKACHYNTVTKYMPESHRLYQERLLWSIHDYLEKIPIDHQYTRWTIQYMYEYQPSEYQRQQACNKLLSLIRMYDADRVEQVAKRCHNHNHVNCKMIDNILKHHLDSAEHISDISQEQPIVPHSNIRGAELYQ